MTSNADSNPREPSPDVAAWKEAVLKYQEPSLGRALWQLVNTLGLYALLWFLAYRSLTISYWLAVPIAILAGGVLVRVFIIFHDCGHGSFFKSKAANDTIGFLTGLLTFTPYYHWRWEHAVHHASVGNLDRRGTGDVWTLTVQEYIEASRWKRFAYRLARNPLVLFVIAPLFLFLVLQRFPSRGASPRERQSVYWMNLAILALAAGLIAILGLKAYLLIQLTAMAVAGSAGIWMFYVQHQFEDVSWERREEWDFTAAALQGSSFYQLPKILQWFTGNIGYHHIHHLSSRIPNYNLERCHRELAVAQDVKPITFFPSLKSLFLRLWDEERRQLVGYRAMRARRRAQRNASTPAG
jgi:acyl-lipid omega-6 desaturase (Delta-12 desaturase)